MRRALAVVLALAAAAGVGAEVEAGAAGDAAEPAVAVDVAAPVAPGGDAQGSPGAADVQSQPAADVARPGAGAASHDGERVVVHEEEVVLVRHGDHLHRVHKMTADEEQKAFYTFILVVFGMFAAQVALYQWKKRHGSSYRAVTLLGLWLIPFALSAHAGYWRFLAAWFLYSTGTGLNIYAVTRPQLKKDVPRRVYSWFLLVHRVTHSLGLGGYGILMAELVGIRELLYLPAWVGSSGLLVLFYGVYFGVLNRDCAEAVTDRIHLRMGYISRKRDDDGGAAGAYVPYNLCALCGKELRALMAESEGDTSHTEQLVKLNCSHEYHEFCIRGWVMVGKRDTCPICGEKVSFTDVLGSSPWKKQSVMWASLLDFMRYMVVWNPIFLVIIQFAANGFGLTKPDPK